jgi:hypothetical protein
MVCEGLIVEVELNDMNFDNLEELEEYATITFQQIEPLVHEPIQGNIKKSVPRNDSKLKSNRTCLNKRPPHNQRPRSQFREVFSAKIGQRPSPHKIKRTSSRTARASPPIEHDTSKGISLKNQIKVGNRAKRKMSPKISQKAINVSNDLANKENTVENIRTIVAENKQSCLGRGVISRFNVFANTPTTSKGHMKTSTQVDLLKPLNTKKKEPNFRIISAVTKELTELKYCPSPKVNQETGVELNRPRRRRADRKRVLDSSTECYVKNEAFKI